MATQFQAECRRFFRVGSDPLLNEILREQEGRRWHGNGVWSLPEGRRAERIAQELGLAGLQQVAYPVGPYGPNALWDILFPFQQDGVRWLVRRTHALLWDEQGLGKTLQAIAWAAYAASSVTVIAPLAVREQWIEAIRRWVPDAEVSRTSSKGNLERVYEGGGQSWTVTTYERCGKHKPIKGATVIVDECTFVKNLKTKRTKATLTHTNEAARVLLLSGHPMVTKPFDLWAIFLILKQRLPKEFWPWVQQYCGAYRTPYGWDFDGATHIRDLRDDMAGFGLRRTKAEVLKDLPPKLWTVIQMPREYELREKEIAEQAAIIEDFIGRGLPVDFGEGGAAMQQLRMECASSKVNFADEWLTQHAEGGGGKVLVFSTFKDPLYSLGDKRKSMLVLTGDVPQKDRDAIIKRFWEDPTCHELGLTYGLGALGLNLQCASTVMLLDTPHTPMELEQATDRAHRIGQLNTVQVIVPRGTHYIEAALVQSMLYKTDLQTALKESRNLKFASH